ncbi:hypothetical protein N7491_010428 [Penicillium cf. griseofulvum]|uniref:Uncharacterized protein n=1 Tax=Penicillium cf. griseofulvum TaxID=2972120 RepID=A0A9W9N036_9EURO|nr:hypothetical protein N7472_000761 [Penicillium cf. griseofulvum]KAJ5421983.1 hypothetical protein N7491_010428 [Penicillium cf. griseofulvum]
MTTTPSIETEVRGGCRDRERRVRLREGEMREGDGRWEMEDGECTLWQSLYISYYTLWEHYVVPTWRLASSSCFSWMKRLHSHTQLVRLQQVN